MHEFTKQRLNPLIAKSTRRTVLRLATGIT